MVANKKVSGYGRDQALNLLSKNVPRKDKKESDHSRTLFTIDNGEPGGSIRLTFFSLLIQLNDVWVCSFRSEEDPEGLWSGS